MLLLISFFFLFQVQDPAPTTQVDFCELIKNPDQFLGKTIQISAVWEAGGVRNVLRTSKAMCPAETERKPFWEKEVIPLYSLVPREGSIWDHQSRLKALALETSKYRARSVTTFVVVKGVFVKLRKDESSKLGDEAFGLSGTWPYAIKIITMLEF